MQLADLFLQGVPGLAPTVRVSLKEGLNVLTPHAPTHWAYIVRTLFHGTGYDAQTPFVASDDPRVGLVFHTTDNATYRVLRGLKNGNAQLAQAREGQYVVMASDPNEVTQRLQSQGKVPSVDVFLSLYWLSLDALLPQTSAAQVVASSASLSAEQRAAFQRELASLRGGSSGARVQTLEFELDGLQKEKFAFEDIAQKRQTLTQRGAQIAAQLAQNKSQNAALDALPADFSTRVAEFTKVQNKHQSDLQKLDDELQVLDAHPPAAPKAFWRDMKFVGATALGALILGASLVLKGDLRLIGLLDIAPFGYAAVHAFVAVGELELTDRHVARRQALMVRRQKWQDKFDADSQMIRQALTQTMSPDTDVLLEMLAGYKAQRNELGKAKQVLAAFDAGEGKRLVEAQGRLTQLDERIGEIEQQLSDLSMQAQTVDARQQQRIDELSRLLSQALSTPSVSATSAEQTRDANTKTVLRGLQSLSGEGLDACAQRLTRRARQYAERLVAPGCQLEVDEAGTLIGLSSSLDAASVARAHLSVRLAACEIAGASSPFPLWIQGLGGTVFADALLAPFLGLLAAKRQVIGAYSGATPQLGGAVHVLG